MTTIQKLAKVDDDGHLRLDVAVGRDDAGTQVEVIIRPAKRAETMTQEEWRAFIERTAGSINDPTFVRPEQPPLHDAPEL